MQKRRLAFLTWVLGGSSLPRLARLHHCLWALRQWQEPHDLRGPPTGAAGPGAAACRGHLPHAASEEREAHREVQLFGALQ